MRRGESGISCLVGVAKPVGPSSHDVVGTIRRVTSERRVGHAGTLDPLASGVMVIGIGQATRLLGLVTLDDKRYAATICFGSETTTDDREGEVSRSCPIAPELRDEAFARAAVARLVGRQEQVPPAYSAISVGGKRAYARARSGEEVTLAPRPIEIYDARLVGMGGDDAPWWRVEVFVSKGTYVRSIARDLGRMVDSAAHLSALERTASGCVSLDSCLSLSGLSVPAILEGCLDPTELLGLGIRTLAATELEDVRCGRRIGVGTVVGPDGERMTPDEAQRVCLVFGQRLYGVWQRRDGRLASVATFPEGLGGVRQ